MKLKITVTKTEEKHNSLNWFNSRMEITGERIDDLEDRSKKLSNLNTTKNKRLKKQLTESQGLVVQLKKRFNTGVIEVPEEEEKG